MTTTIEKVLHNITTIAERDADRVLEIVPTHHFLEQMSKDDLITLLKECRVRAQHTKRVINEQIGYLK